MLLVLLSSALLSALALVPHPVFRGVLSLGALPSILLAPRSLTLIATTVRVVVVLGPLAPVLLAGRLVAFSLPAAVPAAALAAVLGGLAPVAGVVDRELVAAGSSLVALTAAGAPAARLLAARVASRPVPTIAFGPSAPSAALASLSGVTGREVIAALRAPLSFLPGVLGAAVLLAVLVVLSPVAATLF